MSRLPKDIGILGGIVSFCGALLAALLCRCPPLAAARKAGLCAVGVMLVAWLCTHVALGVLHDGAVRRQRDTEA
jgi:hypothetical protein